MSVSTPAGSPADGLALLLRAMHLPTIARKNDPAILRAEAENWGYPRFLSYLFEEEAVQIFVPSHARLRHSKPRRPLPCPEKGTHAKAD